MNEVIDIEMIKDIQICNYASEYWYLGPLNSVYAMLVHN